MCRRDRNGTERHARGRARRARWREGGYGFSQ
jgi:hypothetical protein